VDFRRELLDRVPRLLHVLDVAARAADWKGVRRGGHAQGVALNHYGDGTFIALVADVSIASDRSFRVEKLVCAVDCGQIVNSLSLRAQIEGGLVWGLSAALYGRITIKAGRIEQSNFHDYPVLRMNEMPVLDIHLVESDATPGGIGEPCSPPVAPAVANALFAGTGVRVRTQPFPKRIPSG
jgi:isoquinoline 1-oxidoreductase beta subunit